MTKLGGCWFTVCLEIVDGEGGAGTSNPARYDRAV